MSSVLITGGSRGIGFELARQFAALPDSTIGKILVTTRSDPPAALKDLIKQYPGRVVEVRSEITTEAGVKDLARKVDDELGESGLDILVNNAGIMSTCTKGDIEHLEADQLTNELVVNVVGPQLVTSALLPALRRGRDKKLTFISTTLGSMALAQNYAQSRSHAYKISKAALNMVARLYGLSLEKEGFKVAAISPGWLKTDLGSQYADLDVSVGVDRVKTIILNLDPSTNGKMINIHVPGWENAAGPNQYGGGLAPW